MRGCVAEGGLCTEPSPGTEPAAERCHHPRGHTAEGTSGLQPATEPRGQTLGPINLNSGRGGRAGPGRSRTLGEPPYTQRIAKICLQPQSAELREAAAPSGRSDLAATDCIEMRAPLCSKGKSARKALGQC